MFPKVLIAAPTSSDKDYCLEDWLKQVFSFDYPNYDIIMVDNSVDGNYHKKIIQQGVKCFHIYRGKKSSYQYVTESQELIRLYAIENNYDYLLSLESDVFIKKDTLMKMVLAEKQVYNITYFVDLFRTGNFVPCIQHAYMDGKRIDSHMVDTSIYFTGEVKPILDYGMSGSFILTHTGIGCTLIRRDIFMEVGFKTDGKHFSDSLFHSEILVKGIESFFDSSIIAEHRVSKQSKFVSK